MILILPLIFFIFYNDFLRKFLIFHAQSFFVLKNLIILVFKIIQPLKRKIFEFNIYFLLHHRRFSILKIWILLNPLIKLFCHPCLKLQFDSDKNKFDLFNGSITYYWHIDNYIKNGHSDHRPSSVILQFDIINVVCKDKKMVSCSINAQLIKEFKSVQ